MIKDYCPGFLDPMTGGVVQFGETFAENAERELFEEMGVKGIPLTDLGTFYFEVITVLVENNVCLINDGV